MLIYIITILLLFVFAYCEVVYDLSISLKLGFKYVTFCLLVFQVGLRWETGTDWKAYLQHFEQLSDLSSTSPLLTGMEYGYSLFVWVCKSILEQYWFFLLLHATIFYLLLFWGLKRIAPYFFITLLVFYCSTMGVEGSNRQLIAIVIIMFSLRFVFEKKILPFLCCVFVAFNFHATALVAGIYYVLNRNFKVKYVLAILFIALVIGRTSIPFKLFSLTGNALGGEAASKVLFYLEGAKESISEYGLSFSGLVKRVVFVCIFFYNRDKLQAQLSSYNLVLNGYTIGLVFYFLFSSSLVILVSRGSLYFNMLEPVLLGCQLLLFKRKQDQLVILAMILVLGFLLFFQSIGQYPDLFIPYKGIFINPDFHRELH
jgi:hypothetical protein